MLFCYSTYGPRSETVASTHSMFFAYLSAKLMASAVLNMEIKNSPKSIYMYYFLMYLFVCVCVYIYIDNYIYICVCVYMYVGFWLFSCLKHQNLKQIKRSIS